MRSPSILGLKESSFGSDMPSITQQKTQFCTQDSDSNSEPDMESKVDVNISLDKDSGVDSDNDFIAPDSDLMNKIVTQVESYFSDENLKKDEFVLKHIRRNKDGFISLKLLASFRKVKALTKNWKVVAYCIKSGSKTLELNDNESKIRRKIPLPTVDGDKYSRTIIVYNFAVGSDDIDNISKTFEEFGDIALIRIVKSGSSSVIPQHLLKRIEEQLETTENKTIATIEYNNKSDAENAVKCMERSARYEWRNTIKVMPMKSNNKFNKISFKTNENSRDRSNSYKKSYKQSHEMNISLDINNIANKQRLFCRQKSKSYSSGDESRINNRFSTKSEKFWTKPQLINTFQSVGVIRTPRGPDGTRGFNNNRSYRSSTL